MPLRLRPLWASPIEVVWRRHLSKRHKWRLTYRPPLQLLLIFVQITISLHYFGSVMIPAQLDAYYYWQSFKAIFFLEQHESPVSRCADLYDFYSATNESAARMATDFLMNISFPEPMSQTVTYSNGTMVKTFDELPLTSEFLKSVVTIHTQVPVYIFERDQPGCSKWNVQFTVSTIYSDPAFWLSSIITRSHCPLDVISDDQFANIPYYARTFSLIPRLLLISFVHLVVVLRQVRARWGFHKHWRDTDADYCALARSSMFHFCFGNWLAFELVLCIAVMAGSMSVLLDGFRMTGLPSLDTLRVFALTNVPLSLSSLQFCKFNMYMYHFVAVLAEGCFRLFDVAVGFLPVVCAIFLAGIFLFASIAPKTRSVVSMLEILVSFTLGDNIEPMYIEFTDGTDIFNWMGFVYITLFLLCAGWMVFASFTATIAFVDSKVQRMKKKES